jgi:diketogulonate reductase-like aldo/keto reductase
MLSLSRARTHTHTISVVLFLLSPPLHRQGARAIDTASVYRNEIQIGEAIKESGIPRKIFSKGITSDFKLQYKGYCQAPRR